MLINKKREEIATFLRDVGSVYPKSKREMKRRLDNIISQALSKDRKQLLKDFNNPTYIGVLDSNEKRRGYDIAWSEAINIINKLKE